MIYFYFVYTHTYMHINMYKDIHSDNEFSGLSLAKTYIFALKKHHILHYISKESLINIYMYMLA